MPFPGAREVTRLWVTNITSPATPRVLNILPAAYNACEAARVAEWDSSARPMIPNTSPPLRHALYRDTTLRAQRLDLECFARPTRLQLLRPATVPDGDICSPNNVNFNQRFSRDFLEGVLPAGAQLSALIDYISPVGLASSGDIKGRHHLHWVTALLGETTLAQEFPVRAPAAGRVVAVRKIRFAECACGTGQEPDFQRGVDDSYMITIEYACGRQVVFDHLTRLENLTLRNIADGVWLERTIASTAACPSGTIVGKASIRLCSGLADTARSGQGRACRTDADCTDAGTCIVQSIAGRCLQSFCPPGASGHCADTHRPCSTNGQCFNSVCVPCGQCAANPSVACATNEQCQMAGGGGCNLNSAQTCGEPMQLQDSSAHFVGDLNITVAAGAVIGFEQRANQRERVVLGENRASCMPTAPAMDLGVTDLRADLAVTGVSVPGVGQRRYVNEARYQADTNNGPYSAMRQIACPMTEYPAGEIQSRYSERAGTGMSAADLCVLIHDVPDTLVGQWWGSRELLTLQTEHDLERIAFGYDTRSGVASVSFFGLVGADSMAMRLPISMRYQACAGGPPMAGVACAAPGPRAPVSITTVDRSYDSNPAATGVDTPVVLAAPIDCFDFGGVGAPMGMMGASSFIRVRRSTDPHQIELEIGRGSCSVPVGMSRRVMMYR